LKIFNKGLILMMMMMLMLMLMLMRCLLWLRFRAKPGHLPYKYIIYIYLPARNGQYQEVWLSLNMFSTGHHQGLGIRDSCCEDLYHSDRSKEDGRN
jgi:hypothetical protein